jgi:hypothetical protein
MSQRNDPSNTPNNAQKKTGAGLLASAFERFALLASFGGSSSLAAERRRVIGG